jgi:AraC-like DNA-binding protein
MSELSKSVAFINRLRMEQVRQLRKANRPAKEISQLTGFSEYYVRKIWNTKG